MTYHVSHFINGEILAPTGKTLPIYNPATGDAIGQVSLAEKSTIEKAVTAAKNAFPSWAKTPPLKRARIFFKFKALLEAHLDELAEMITREHGKTLTDARGSIQRGIDVVELVCGIPSLLKGTYSEDVATEMDSYTIRQPLGVCCGITPFNFPAMIPLWMFPMAIACGNTFILKPSEKDPSCSLRLAELLKEAGLPNGVLNVVQGNKDAVDLLLTHPGIAAVSFVGSTAVAEFVYQTATMQGKRVQAFGGAKNHCVIMQDADLEQAADALVSAAYGSAGERCMAISVALAVGDKVADELVNKIKARSKNLKIGNGSTKDVDIGPLISEIHREKVLSYINSGIKEGAELVIDGRELKVSGHEKGFFLGPTFFDKVTPNMRIYKEEIFGPVLSLVRVKDLASALELINNHEYGNGTAIFTRDGNAARTFANQVQVGMVGINIPIPVPVAYHSFGGWKRSMFGDVRMHGQQGVQFYTKLKTITQKWLKTPEGLNFNIPTH